MDILSRLLALAAAAFTVGMTAVMLFTFRKPRRLSVGSTLISMIIAVLVPQIYILISGIRIQTAIAAPLLISGFLLGFARGHSTEILVQDGKTYTRLSLLALLGWGLSLSLAQVMGFLQTGWLAAIGLLPVAFSTGMQLGLQGNLFLRLMVQRLAPMVDWLEDAIGITGSTVILLILGIVLLLGASSIFRQAAPEAEAAAIPDLSTPTLTSIPPVSSTLPVQPSVTPTSEPRLIPENGLVVMLRAGWAFGQEGPNDLYLADPATSEVRKLNEVPIYSVRLPVLSPDGIHLAFVSEQSGQSEIYLSKVDGTGVQQLTQDDDQDNRPFWSWDGSYLYFISKANSGWDLIQFCMETLEMVEVHRFEYAPASLTLSPNGEILLYSVGSTDSSEAHWLNLVGGEDRLLKREDAVFNYAWAPDGSQFAMLIDDDGSNPDSLRVFQSDGRGERVLDQGLRYGLSVTWSPDSQRLAYLRDVDMVEEIAVLAVDGSDMEIISHPEGSFGDPVWSPDGEWLAFDAVRGQFEETGWDAFAVRPDGSEERQLTRQLATDEMYIYRLTWIP